MLERILVHPSTRRTLETIVRQRPHALLITGEEHLGKHLLARSLVATLVETTPEQLDSYGMFREISAVKGTITIEMIRSLLTFFALVVPGSAKMKRVVIIADADMMTLAAQNALLKLLEEPPVGTLIILTTSHIGKVLPTLRSRCQICHVQKPSEDDTKDFLNEYDDEAVRSAVLVSGGIIGAAKQILDAHIDEEINLQSAKSFLGVALFEQLLSIERYSKDREQATQFVSLLILIAERGLLKSRSSQWQRIMTAALTADAALKKNANIKLTLTELALSLR